MAILSVISMAVTMLVLLAGGIAIYRSYREKNSEDTLYFSIFFLGYALMHFFLMLGAVYSTVSSQIAGWLYVAAHVVTVYSTAFFLRLPLKLTLLKLERLYYFFLLFATAAAAVMAINPPLPQGIPGDVTYWNVTSQIQAAMGIYMTITLLLSFILFIKAGLGVSEKSYKIRSFLISLGFFIFLTAGPLHNFAKTTAGYLLADAVTPIGAGVLLLGVYYPSLFAKKKVKASS